MEKDFQLIVCSGSVLQVGHPNYFNGRFRLEIKNELGTVEFEKNGFTLKGSEVEKVKEIVIKNYKKLKALQKTTPWEIEGIYCAIYVKVDNEEIKLNTGYHHDKTFQNVYESIRNIVLGAISSGNVVKDENSPNPIKDAENSLKLEEKRRYVDDINERFLYANFKVVDGEYIYDDVIKEMFECVGINNPKYKDVQIKNYMKEKSIDEMSADEIVGQFKYWDNEEKINNETLAKLIQDRTLFKAVGRCWQLLIKQKFDFYIK